ncbi:hypothetical protein BD410DRAFT_899521 [Rickenella mellea]|uniref:Nephrocystin 3-like N-terminal domain-containing protein n=1 Tax=Rickenella mellea TaxID=50990 RepID=A0A4Y7PZS1_9AGAM|nr:hypothetical protein BD410DRAFT_899521 [Rickenella mellea]
MHQETMRHGPLEDGIYKIVNAAITRRNYIVLTSDGHCAASSGTTGRPPLNGLWNISILDNGRFFIRPVQRGGYASPTSSCDRGSPVVVQPNAYDWVIKQTKVSPREFVICHVGQLLCWGLADDAIGSPIIMREPPNGFGNQWTFEKYDGDISALPPSRIDPPTQQIYLPVNQHPHPATFRHDLMLQLRENAVDEARYDHRAPWDGCLIGTREGVVSNILQWTQDCSDRPICWLSGAAGSGKSAIAQEVAARLDDEKQLLASFFFRRGEDHRSNSSHLITTLAYQVTVSMPATKPLMEKVLREYPSIMKQPLHIQFEKLLVNILCQKPNWIQRVLNRQPPKVIIIDALDECDDKSSIEDFIKSLLGIIQSSQVPLQFFFTSRVEEHIRKGFELCSSAMNHLSLDDFDARVDIRALFRFEFQRILNQNVQKMDGVAKPWPSDYDIEALVKKSSGLFIFASTLIKFVNAASRPHVKLQELLKMHNGIDPLYIQVLSTATHGDHFNEVFGTAILLRIAISINELAQLLQLDIDIVLDELFSVQSIIKSLGIDLLSVASM